MNPFFFLSLSVDRCLSTHHRLCLCQHGDLPLQMECRSVAERPASLILHQQKVRSLGWFTVDFILFMCSETSNKAWGSCMSHQNLTLSSDTPTAPPKSGPSVLTTAPRGPTSASSMKITPPSGPSTPSSCDPETSPSSMTRRSWMWSTLVRLL